MTLHCPQKTNEILDKILPYEARAMEFQEKMLLRFTEVYVNQITTNNFCTIQYYWSFNKIKESLEKQIVSTVIELKKSKLPAV